MRLWRKIAALFRRNRREADMATEMQTHLDLQARVHERAGMSAQEAHRVARRDFGGVEQMKERAREVRSIVWIGQIGQDLRYAIRQFARTPGYVGIVILTLGLGIGATTAIYSMIDGVVLNPVPGPNSDRLVQIGRWIQYVNRPQADRAGLMLPMHEALMAEREFFAETTWSDQVQFERKGEDFSTTVGGSMVPVNFFPMLGVRPLFGRLFVEDDAVAFERQTPERDTAILLNYAWWKSEFGGDPAILGREVALGPHRFTVIGVMPEYFRFPDSHQYWLPVKSVRYPPGSMGSSNIRFIGRLKPGIVLTQAEALLGVVRNRLLEDFPDNDRHYGEYWRRMPGGLRLWVLPLQEAMQLSYSREYDTLRRTLLGFFGAIGFVLAIVCANIANLTLARTERRQHELAVRMALGAGHARLLRQLLTESLLLAFFGGLAGVVASHWGIKLLAAFNTMPQLRPIEIDGRVFWSALAASLLTGLFFGVVPAWRAGRMRINRALTQSGAGATAGVGGVRYRNALVIAEIALAMVLLTGAGLTIQSVVKLLRVDPGYDPANLVKVYLPQSGLRADQSEKRNAVIFRIHERLAALPGVSAVGVFKDEYTPRKIAVENRSEPILAHGAHAGWGNTDFFRATRARLLAGRLLEPGDLGDAGTVVVNETMAHLCWPGEDAIGKRFRVTDRRGEPAYEVVGVVSDTRLSGFNETIRALFYRPFPEADIAGSTEILAVRTERDPVAVTAAIRQALRAESASLRMPSITLFSQALHDTTRPQRTFRNYLVAFAGVGLVLAALGIYGVLAYSVTRRTREIGIRMAVGADRSRVIRMIMRDGGRLVAIGVGVGLLAAFWLTTLLEKQLFATSPRDPLVLGIAAVVLSAITLLACWLPARRAAKVNPMVALRSE